MDEPQHRPISRRRVLQLGAVAVPSALLAACVDPSPSGSPFVSAGATATAGPAATATPVPTPTAAPAPAGRFLYRDAALADGHSATLRRGRQRAGGWRGDPLDPAGRRRGGPRRRAGGRRRRRHDRAGHGRLAQPRHRPRRGAVARSLHRSAAEACRVRRGERPPRMGRRHPLAARRRLAGRGRSGGRASPCAGDRDPRAMARPRALPGHPCRGNVDDEARCAAGRRGRGRTQRRRALGAGDPAARRWRRSREGLLRLARSGPLSMDPQRRAKGDHRGPRPRCQGRRPRWKARRGAGGRGRRGGFGRARQPARRRRGA